MYSKILNVSDFVKYMGQSGEKPGMEILKTM